METENMKLYLMECGQMIIPDHNILALFNTEQLRLVIPVPAYLLMHPTQGIILIDCGFNYDHLPLEMKKGVAWSPLQKITTQLQMLGYEAKDVKHVILSHLHFDHAGQMKDFSHATFHIRKSEWEAAISSSRSDYILEDFMDARNFEFDFLEEEKDVDLFQDNSLICLSTPGHSPGNTSFLISLNNFGKVLLTADAAHMQQYFNSNQYYQDAWNVEKMEQSIEKLKQLEQDCSLVIFGHDPKTWNCAKKIPEFYD